MKKKSISPIIATILLIIMTVGIAALMYTWMTGMFSQLTSQAEQQAGGLGAVNFDLIYVSHSENNFIVTLLNSGRVSLNFNREGIFVNVEYYQKPYGTKTSSTCTINNKNDAKLQDVKPGSIADLNLSCQNAPVNPDLYRYLITINYLGVVRSVTYG
ncbi:MAG: archaellin/type IV pilin N-terminal domain-containing protein [Nanopusillaceae archaeon]